MTELIKILLSLLPVFLFLLALIFLDSYKLVRPLSVFITIIAGFIAAILCYFINTWFFEHISIYKYFGPPIIEEIVKASFLFFLMKTNKIGFLVDAAIYGFAIGAGFAFIENVYYLQVIDSSNMLIWIIRGLGTAVMHGSTTALFGIITKSLFDGKGSEEFRYILPGLFVAVLIHAVFNQLLIRPVATTLSQLILLPIIVFIIYNKSENFLRNWMELNLETDMNIIEQINSDKFSDTKIGKYLYSLKNTFPSEILIDILCYIKIYMELSIRAKGILLSHEAGFNPPVPKDVLEKINELKHLEKNIGATGRLALSPILKGKAKDLWQIYFLNNK